MHESFNTLEILILDTGTINYLNQRVSILLLKPQA